MSSRKRDIELMRARARLFEWGSCVRAVALHGAPHPHMYSQQPFVNERVNFDFAAVAREVFAGQRFERAIEVEEILNDIKSNNKKMYAALVVRYVERDPGGRRKRSQEQQIFRWWSKTKLGKTAYYSRLHKAEKYLSMALAGSG